MTNTYDTSNFLPCPFCGAKPEAMDWHAGPRARIFVDCPNGNYDDEHGGCSVGPSVVGSDMEDAAARWNRRAQVPDDLPPVPYNEHEKKLLKEIESRYYWEEKATELAERVGEYFGFNVGEHSNINCPVQTALEADWQPPQASVPEGFLRHLASVIGAVVSTCAPEGGEENQYIGGRALEELTRIEKKVGAMLTASPAPEHSGDGNEMVGWISVNEQTPSQGERVLLKIDLEDCPVVGYWGCGRYEACTVNMEVSCGAFCYCGNVDGSFSGEDVTHWMPLPNPPQQEEAER